MHVTNMNGSVHSFVLFTPATIAIEGIEGPQTLTLD